MAISVDATSLLAYGGGTSWSHTCAAGASILWVYVRCDAGAATAVTYNGVGLTQVNSIVNTGTYNLWYLNSPAAGANTIAVTAPGQLGALAASYIASKNAAPDASTTNTAGGGDIGTTVTTIADNCWAVYGVCDRSGAAPTAGTGSTLRVAHAATSMALFDSGGPKTPAGTLTMHATATGTCRGLMASFAPAPLGAGRMFSVF